MRYAINDRIQTDPVWKDYRGDGRYNVLSPFDGFDKAEPKKATLADGINAQRDWFQEFNLLAFHLKTYYHLPDETEVIYRKRKGARWITVNGFDYESDYRGVVTRRRSE